MSLVLFIAFCLKSESFCLFFTCSLTFDLLTSITCSITIETEKFYFCHRIVMLLFLLGLSVGGWFIYLGVELLGFYSYFYLLGNVWPIILWARALDILCSKAGPRRLEDFSAFWLLSKLSAIPPHLFAWGGGSVSMFLVLHQPISSGLSLIVSCPQGYDKGRGRPLLSLST